jgi:hypothetical protein
MLTRQGETETEKKPQICGSHAGSKPSGLQIYGTAEAMPFVQRFLVPIL